MRLADDVNTAESKSSNERTTVGDAQSKLVKDIMSRQVEQEAAVRGNTKVEVPSLQVLPHCGTIGLRIA